MPGAACGSFSTVSGPSGACTPPWFLRMVRGAILPALFYRAPCWASVLCSSGRIAQLDGVLALAGRLAFGLERTTLGEACRALAGLFSARQYIMQSLIRYLWRQHRSKLQTASLPQVPEHYVTPRELGRAWSIRAVRGHTLITPIPWRRRLVYEGVDSALRLELQRSWAVSDRGRMLYEVIPRVGREWQPWDIDQVPRRGVTLVARFFIGHCHLGVFSIPWDPLERISCPLCGGDFSREHLLWNCTTVSKQREEFLSRGVEVWGKDLGRLAHLGLGSLSRFLLAIRPTFWMENVEGVSGC